jgi:hypothetical protein
LRLGTFVPLRCRNCLFQVGRRHELLVLTQVGEP